jgi:hypothetical protein
MHGEINVGRIAFRNFADHFFRGRIDGRECLAANGWAKLITDQNPCLPNFWDRKLTWFSDCGHAGAP